MSECWKWFWSVAFVVSIALCIVFDAVIGALWGEQVQTLVRVSAVLACLVPYTKWVWFPKT